MFTGIVEGTGKVLRITGDENLTIELQSPYGESIRTGASIAVAGVCLTLLEQREDRLSFEIGQETLEKSTLGNMKVGDRLNLERPLRPDGRLDGHYVLGHVDCTATTREVRRDPEMIYQTFEVPNDYLHYLIYKGSVAIDGVSLTVNKVEGNCFEVALLPYTYEITTLGNLKSGDPVNIEFDMIGKYVMRFLQTKTNIKELR